MLDVSVVVPSYNRKDRLARTLAGLEKQDFPMDRFEVIVVSDGSTDGTTEFLQKLNPPFPFKQAVQENQGAAAARNRGVQLAAGKIILFIDDDIVPAPRLISEHFAWHQKNGANAVVIGPMLTPPDFRLSPWVNWEQNILARYYDAMVSNRFPPTPRQFYTGNASLERRHLIDGGGFDPSFRRAEDVELAYRLEDRGLCFFFNPDAVGYHYAERSFDSWIGTPYAYGKNDVIFSQEKNQGWLLPTVMCEFHTRHLFIRILTYACLSRSTLKQAVIRFLKGTILFGEKIQFNQLSMLACSGIFNLQYYQGVSDQLGSRKIFFERITKAKKEMAIYV